jgi:hypothetical protein
MLAFQLDVAVCQLHEGLAGLIPCGSKASRSISSVHAAFPQLNHPQHQRLTQQRFGSKGLEPVNSLEQAGTQLAATGRRRRWAPTCFGELVLIGCLLIHLCRLLILVAAE